MDDPTLPRFHLYLEPERGHSYVIGADPAEGDPHADASAATIIDAATWEEAAHVHGHWEPVEFAGYLARLATLYNDATICCERNNHGHAVHVALRALNETPAVYKNPHDGKDGWLSNAKYKTLAVDHAAQVFRDGACRIHTRALYDELAQFSASTLSAPPGEHDDRAMSLIIALAALRWPSGGGRAASVLVTPPAASVHPGTSKYA